MNELVKAASALLSGYLGYEERNPLALARGLRALVTYDDEFMFADDRRAEIADAVQRAVNDVGERR